MAYNDYGNPAYMPFGTPNIQSGTNDIQGVRRVANLDEVKAASVPYGFRCMFMHNTEPYIYIKDYTGNIRMYQCQEIEQPKPEDMAARLNELEAKYESLVRQTATQQPAIQPTQYEPNENYAGNAELSGNPGASQAGVLQADGRDGPGSTASEPVVISNSIPG